jgi:adenylate kinase family enzyme
MGNGVLVLGQSGSGKTTSIRNLDRKKTVLCAVEKQRLPFREGFPMTIKQASYALITQLFQEIGEGKRPDIKTVVIDDSQYLLVNEFFDRATEKGYDKFTSIALNFRNLIHWVNIGLPEDVTVYFLHHTQVDEYGRTKAKTIGKMLDEKLTVEGCFDIVLMTEHNQDGWWFRTHGGSGDPVKTPMDMFKDDLVPNDLAIVDKTIREYYGLEAAKK